MYISDGLSVWLSPPPPQSLSGIVTLEDLFEEMIQEEIYDEHDSRERKAIQALKRVRRKIRRQQGRSTTPTPTSGDRPSFGFGVGSTSDLTYDTTAPLLQDASSNARRHVNGNSRNASSSSSSAQQQTPSSYGTTNLVDPSLLV